MALSRKVLPVLLYFYQGNLTQADADKVVETFNDKDVHFRKVADINDTRDLTERCAYASGTVPLIYFVRKSADVLTDGVLADPLGRPNAAKPTADGKDTDGTPTRKVSLTTGHVQPSDAVIAAKLLKDELGQREQQVGDPDIEAKDVKVDVVAAGATTEAEKAATEAAAKAKTEADEAAVAAAANKAAEDKKAKDAAAKAAATKPTAPVAPATPVAPK